MSESTLSSAQEVAGFGNWVLDLTSGSFECSGGLVHILGKEGGSIRGSSQFLLHAVHRDDRFQVEQTLRRSVQTEPASSLEYRVVRPDATEVTVHQNTKVIFDETGSPCRLLGTVQDITERREAETRIRELAYYDNVTGLPNRVLLNQYLTQALSIAKRYGRSLAILFIDLDHFNASTTPGDIRLETVSCCR